MRALADALDSLGVDPRPLTLAEHVVLRLASVDPPTRRELEHFVAWLDVDDWRSVASTLQVQGMRAHGYARTEVVRGLLPRPVVDRMRAGASHAAERDGLHGILVDELAPILERERLHHAFVKGIVLERAIRRDGDPARGAADIDVMLFDGRASLRRCTDLLLARRFVLTEDALGTRDPRRRDIGSVSLRRKYGALVFNVDLHTCIADRLADEPFMAFLARSVIAQPWEPLLRTGPRSVSTLDPLASYVHLAAETFRDRRPKLRTLFDLARILADPSNASRVRTLPRELGPVARGAATYARLLGAAGSTIERAPWIVRAFCHPENVLRGPRGAGGPMADLPRRIASVALFGPRSLARRSRLRVFSAEEAPRRRGAPR